MKTSRYQFFGVLVVTLLMYSQIALAQDDFKIFDGGIVKFRSKDYDGVILDFTNLISKPNHTKKLDEDLYFYRGQAYYFTGEYTNSVRDLQQSLTLDHYSTGVIHWFIARCYDKQNKSGEASDEYKTAARLLEKNRKVYSQFLADRAQFYTKKGDRAAAQQDLALASNLNKGVTVNNTSAPGKSRNAGENQKSTPQVIVTTKPKQKDQKAAARQQPVQQSTPPQEDVHSEPVKTLPVSLGAANKDEKRYALVIGNSTYPKEIGVLKNPANDATDIAQELRGSDFEVQLLINATYVQIREAVRKFHEKLTNGLPDQTVGLFYYAGHGIQFQDENYLVPIDAKVQFEDDIVRMCFPVQRMVLANMERSNSRMNIVILDACRNNPFPAATRSAGSGGLTEMKRARGSFIAYATAPGSVAADGSGRNGLYTQELLKAMRKPGLTIEQVFKDVRQNVLRLSGDNQNTWDSSNIVGEFYFKLN